MSIYNFFDFWAGCVTLVAAGVIPEVKVPTNTRLLVGIVLFDRPQTFCPKYLVFLL